MMFTAYTILEDLLTYGTRQSISINKDTIYYDAYIHHLI